MKARILVVEDSDLNQRLLKKILEDEYDIIAAYDGIEALSIIGEQYNSIAAVILDLHMPKMSGQELMEKLQQEDKYANLPILVATAEHNKVLERQCLKLGAWDFVTKPYDNEVIKLRLNNIIARSQIQLVNKIKLLSERDTLTNIYNRRYFMEQAENMVKTNPDTIYSIIRMDIDNFRLYNSSFGAAAGDKLLIYIADKLKKELDGQQAVYGRIESDVFCVCTPHNPDFYEGALIAAEENMKKICVDYRLNLSFGIYVISDPSIEMEKAYSYVTVASRECKKSINSLFKYYTQEMQEEEEKSQQIVNTFQTAIDEKQFKVFLQPKYALADERACGAEALVRWFHPTKGMISPGEFIPVFEKNGQIIELDYYMWESVCEILHDWIKKGREPFPISVNISRISMYNPQIVDQIVSLTDKYNVPKTLLNLEITESAYMSNPELMEIVIKRLRRYGFVILMDDFGSGYSSLNTLKNIDVDILKVDMKFLPTGADNGKSEKILASVIRMAAWIDMPVVVEGVETKEQKEFLDSIGTGGFK